MPKPLHTNRTIVQHINDIFKYLQLLFLTTLFGIFCTEIVLQVILDTKKIISLTALYQTRRR